MIDFNDPVRKVDAIGLCAVALLTGLAWFGVVTPVEASRAGDAERALRLQTLTASADAAEAEVEALERRTTEARALAARAELRTRPVTELNARISALVASAEAADLRTDTVRPGDPRPDGAAVRVPIRVAGRGSYPALTAFLDSLHANDRDIAVTGVTVARGDGATGAARFEVDLTWWATPG